MTRKLRRTCRNGHRYTKKNTKILVNGDKSCRTCKKCITLAKARHYKKHAEYINKVTRERTILRRYGLTLDTLNIICDNQGNRCALCHSNFTPKGARKMCIDHDHKTGVVRGLLCHTCNTALGWLGDDPSGIYRVIKYLETSANGAILVQHGDKLGG